MTIVTISGKNRVYLANIIGTELYGCEGLIEKDNEIFIVFNDFKMERIIENENKI